MTRVTTRPDSTLLNTFTLVGARSADAALSAQDFGTSYVYVARGAGGNLRLGWAEPTIPAGAVVKRMEMRLWVRVVSSSVQAYINMRANGSQAAPENLLVVSNTASTWLTASSWDETVSPTAVEGYISVSLAPSDILISEAEIVTTYVAKPTVVVNAPAGTVTTTNLPTVSWVPTLDVDGGPQQAFAVYIYRRSYYSAIDFVPGASYPPTAAFELASAGTSWTPTTALPDDTYRAYVRVAQYVNGSVLWSDWAYSQFTVSVSRPQAPLTAASAESDFARNRLTVSDGQGIVDDFDTNTLSQYTVTNEVTISGGALVFGTAGVTGGGDAIHNGVALTDVVTVADVSLGSIGRSAASVYMRATSSSRALSANVTVNTLLGRGGILSVLAGSSTLASVTLRTTPSAATRYWLRATAIGDVVTAEWWTTDPALGGSPTDTCSTTLSGANKTTYGAGVVGKAGVSAGVSDSSRTLSYVGRFSAQPAVPADLFEIQASYDGRATWSAVRTTAGEGGFVTPAAGRAAAWDFEAPNGGEVNYRVRALHSYSGVYAVSDWVEASATWSSSQEWLVHPLDPSKSMRIRIVESSERQREARQGIHRPLGRATPIVVSDATGAEIGTLTIDVDIADHPLLDALIDARVPLLVLGAAGSAWPFPRYVVLGSPGRVEGGAKGFSTWTLNTLPWTQVDRPSGGLLTVPA